MKQWLWIRWYARQGIHFPLVMGVMSCQQSWKRWAVLPADHPLKQVEAPYIPPRLQARCEKFLRRCFP